MSHQHIINYKYQVGDKVYYWEADKANDHRSNSRKSPTLIETKIKVVNFDASNGKLRPEYKLESSSQDFYEEYLYSDLEEVFNSIELKFLKAVEENEFKKSILETMFQAFLKKKQSKK